jgi:uncharacterized damage-inducible protein DinB
MPRPQQRAIGNNDLAKSFLTQAQRLLRRFYLPRIGRCLRELSKEEIWWRPNSASNSVGNLVRHLEGNVRQWIISGLGGAPDTRQRDLEFRERGPIPSPELLAGLRTTVGQACRVLARLSPEDLARRHSIQGFRVTGLEAVFHVAEHFSHHAGQIILVTKFLRGKDLRFTHLPVVGKSKGRAKTTPRL